MGHNLDGYDVSLEDAIQLAKAFETLANRVSYNEIKQLFLFESKYYQLVAKCKREGITEEEPLIRQADEFYKSAQKTDGLHKLPVIYSSAIDSLEKALKIHTKTFK